MPKPKYHVFVCQNERRPENPETSCIKNGSRAVLDRFKELRREEKLFKLMLVTKTGCMGRCSTGPTVVVYPHGVWYMKVEPKDVDEIIESHIKNDKPVKRLLLEERFWA